MMFKEQQDSIGHTVNPFIKLAKENLWKKQF